MAMGRAKGAAKEAKASIIEAIGKLTGDTKVEAEASTDTTAGKVQVGARKTTNTVRNTSK